MRFEDIGPKSNVGREFQHLEDLVFIEGSIGAYFAISVLENLAESTNNVMVKWDGMPTIYWGRNPAGEFVMTNKNAWGKHEITSPRQLESFILNTGNNEEWRDEYARGLFDIWETLEQQTPKDFRGYIYGDLLFSPNTPYRIKNEAVEFTPNKVTYRVSLHTELGLRLAEAKVAIAAHKIYNSFGDKQGQPFVEGINTPDLIVFAQTRANGNVVLEQEHIEKLHKKLAENKDSIDAFLEPFRGLSDLSNIMYTYVNQMSKANRLDDLRESFFEWLPTSKVSVTKQARIEQLSERHPGTLNVILELVTEIMSIKNSIIHQLDETAVEITASTLNEAGGEGYIMLDEKVKLVPRHRWKPH